MVARTTAAWPAATFDVPHMPAWGLAVTALGIAWLGLWRSRLRLVGVPVIALGLVSPMLVRPPDLLVSADARLIGVRTPARCLSAAGIRCARSSPATPGCNTGPSRIAVPIPIDGEAADGAIACSKEACLLRPVPGAKAALLVRGAAHPDGCGEASVIVSAEPARGLCPRPGRRWSIASPCGATAPPRSGWTAGAPGS